MTDLDIYQQPNGQIDQYQAGIIMTPEQAKALDDQVRACTRAVLREGTDYGTIPGTGDDTKTLKKPGAEKLLQWFRLFYTMECLEIERDSDGTKQGATYRCNIVKNLGDGRSINVATCEGYAGYDEAKFYKTAEQARHDAEAKERYWAAKDRRVANPEKWKHLDGYRAPWNTVIKMSQKRALVGAAIVATAAGGLFTDQEEDDHSPVPQDDGPSWLEIAIAQANTFTDLDEGRALYLEAAEAHKDGRCNRRQQDLIQNTVAKRAKKLQAAVVVEAEDLAARAEAGHAQDAAEDTQQPPDDDTEPVDDTLPVEDPPDWPQDTKPGTGKPKGK